MPNNNPQGHNQYSKRRDPMQQAASPDAQTSDAAIDQAEHTDSAELSTAPRTDTSPPAGSPSPTPAKRGFAAMDEATQRTIASKGGQSQGKGNNPGNFANDRDRAREAGRKGGEAHGHRQQ
jgi:general stress protein YciG